MKSFLVGKRSLDIAPLRSPHAAASLAEAARCSTGAAAPSGVAPQVDVVKQGDKIVRIIVTCTCGERTEIECLYPPGQ
jgi:hypothetical protein